MKFLRNYSRLLTFNVYFMGLWSQQEDITHNFKDILWGRKNRKVMWKGFPSASSENKEETKGISKISLQCHKCLLLTGMLSQELVMNIKFFVSKALFFSQAPLEPFIKLNRFVDLRMEYFEMPWQYQFDLWIIVATKATTKGHL